MMSIERQRQLAQGRATAAKNREQATKQRAREHKANDRIYHQTVEAYYRTIRIHGAGSEPERKAWRKMIAAEVAWFKTHPA